MSAHTVLQKGTRDDPVHRGGYCAFAGCLQHGSVLRVAGGGYWVRYCPRHEMQAHLIFDQGDPR